MTQSKRLVASLMAMVFLLGNVNGTVIQGKPQLEKEEYLSAETRIIVKYKGSPRNVAVPSYLMDSPYVASRQGKTVLVERETISKNTDVAGYIAELEARPEVDYVQIDYPLEAFSVTTPDNLPVEAFIEKQWALNNEGQKIQGQEGLPGADIRLGTAYGHMDMYNTVLVAVPDTGIDTSHEDLDGVFENPQNILDGSVDVTPGDGYNHGTQIAGIIAGKHNGEGIAGVAPNARIMPVKMFERGEGYTSDAVAAIEYAIANGARIINCSWGSPKYNPILKDLMAENPHVLFVCAAGNKGGTTYIYPAAFDLPNVLSVTSSDNQDKLAETANYGHFVDIAAPGVDIYTTETRNSYGYANGTSMATAYVSGAAALYMGKYPDATPAQVKGAVKQGARGPQRPGEGEEVEDAGEDKPISGTSGSSLAVVPESGGREVRPERQSTVPLLDIEKMLSISDPDIEETPTEPWDPDYEVGETIDWENLPDGVKILLERRYTSLTEEERGLLLEYLHAREDTMTICDESGMNVKESLYPALMMQRHNRPLADIQKMIVAHGGEEQAFYQSKKWVEYQYTYVGLNGEDEGELVDLLVDGYTAKHIVYAYVVWQGLELKEPLKQIIAKEITVEMPSWGNQPGATTSAGLQVSPTKTSNKEHNEGKQQESQRTVKAMAAKYGVLEAPLKQYLDDNGITVDEMQFRIQYFQEDTYLIPDDALEMFSSNSTSEIPTGAFVYQENTTEDININNGNMVYTDTIASLAGRNGFDLDLTMVYESRNATNDRAGGFIGGERDWSTSPPTRFNDNTIIRNNISRNPLRFAGTGWKFNFSQIIMRPTVNPTNLIILPTGEQYFFPVATTGKLLLIDYRKAYMTLRTAENSEYPLARYVVEYVDGRKEYLDYSGNLLALRDKYNNTIQFEYGDVMNSGYYGVKITDTMGRIVIIGYENENKMVVQLPDGNKVTLNLTNHPAGPYLNNKVDQEGRSTRYTYDRFILWFNRFPGLDGTIGYCANYVRGNVIERVRYVGATNGRDSLLLNKVAYPTGMATEYTYNKLTYYIGPYGNIPYEQPVIASRQDVFKNVAYNRAEYQFSTYYDNRTDIDNYKTIMKKNGMETTYIFNYKQHTLREELVKFGGKEILKKEYKYDYYDNPSQVTETVEGKKISTEIYQYASNGIYLLKHFSPLAEGTRNNEYLTNIVYDYTYYIPISVTYKQDAQTTIVETNTLTADKKNIAGSIITVNGVQKGRKDFTYDAYGNVSSMTEYSNGSTAKTTTYQYKDGVYPVKVTTGSVTQEYTYDNMGNVLTAKDPNGHITSYTYDRLGRPTRVTHPDGGGETTAYVTNANENSVKMTNALGHTMQYFYDGLGNPTSVKDITGGQVKATYTYDNRMRLTEETDAKGNQTQYAYDHLDRMTRKWTSAGYEETYGYNDVYLLGGQYYGRVLKTIVGSGNTPSIQTTYYTDAYGRAARDGFYFGDKEYLNSCKFDYLGNVVEELQARDQEAGRSFTTKYEVDHQGRVTKTTNGENKAYTVSYDWLGRKISAKDPKGNESTFVYDNMNRLVREQRPFQGNYFTLKEYKYDNNGNLLEESISNNRPGTGATWRKTAYTYDNRNRMTRVSSYDHNAVTAWTDYTYDAAGNKTAIKTAKGTQTTSYAYNTQSQLVKMTDPLGQTETYIYDANGNLLTKKDRNGNTTTNTYDGMNRLTKTTVATPTGTASQFLEYTYGKTGAKIAEKNENMTVNYVYDSLGRVIKATETGGVEKAYTYDLLGNMTTFQLKRNNAQLINGRYDYDTLGRMIRVYQNNALMAAYTYDVNGNRASLTLGNGVVSTYNYNEANLVTSLNNNKGGTVLSAYTYTYYLDGNQAGKKDHMGRTTNYTYNGLNQLTMEAETGSGGNTSWAYAYDGAGNRATMTVTGSENHTTSYSYDKNNRLLTETKAGVGENATKYYTYDPNGNQRTMSTTLVAPLSDSTEETAQGTEAGPDGIGTYEINTYDVFNRLSATENGTASATYNYRPDGLRLSKTVDGVTTTHVWSGQNIVADVTGNTTSAFVYGVGRVSSGDTYYLYNAHGDVVQLANNNGVVTRDYHYDAFGVEIGEDEQDTNPFRYCGEYFDRETGKIYLRARYYNPVVGRFETEDSYWNINNMIYGDSWNTAIPQVSINAIYQSGNLYLYGINNPIRYIDMSGEKVYVAGYTLNVDFGIHLEGDFGLCWDDNGDWGFVGVGSYGEGWIGLSAGGYYSEINAESINSLNGLSVEIGGGVSVGFLGLDVAYTLLAKDEKGNQYDGYIVAGSLGASLLPLNQNVKMSYGHVNNMSENFRRAGRKLDAFQKYWFDKMIESTLNRFSQTSTPASHISIALKSSNVNAYSKRSGNDKNNKGTNSSISTINGVKVSKYSSSNSVQTVQVVKWK